LGGSEFDQKRYYLLKVTLWISTVKGGSNLLSNVRLWPNPASNILNVTLADSYDEVDRIIVLDVFGREVYNVPDIGINSNNSILVDVHGLCPGGYFLRYSGRGRVGTVPFVVVR